MANKKDTQNYFVQSALREISLFRKHFHITGQGDAVTVSGEIAPLDIINFKREYFSFVRPLQLSDNKILPAIDHNKLRGLYLGQPDANILLNLIIRHCLYVDQIVIIDPFNDLPYEQIIERPAAWVEVLVNRALCLCALEEWIKQEVVLIIPNMIYYHPKVRSLILEKSSKVSYLTSTTFDEASKKLTIIRLLLSVEREHRSSMFNVLKEWGVSYSTDAQEELLNQAVDYETKYPIRFRLTKEFYDRYFKDDRRGQIVDFSVGTSLLIANDIADAIGAFLIFEHKSIYQHVLEINLSQKQREDNFQKLGLAFQELEFPFLHNISLKQALMLRRKGYLSRFRIVFKRFMGFDFQRTT